MSPKEKAKELFNKYCKFLWYGVIIDPDPKYALLRKRATEAAIIAVDEIIPCTWKWKTYEMLGYIDVDQITTTEYWNDVKTELQKL